MHSRLKLNDNVITKKNLFQSQSIKCIRQRVKEVDKENFLFYLCPFHSYSSRIVSSGFEAKEPTCGIYLGILSLARSRKVLSGWSMSDQL